VWMEGAGGLLIPRKAPLIRQRKSIILLFPFPSNLLCSVKPGHQESVVGARVTWPAYSSAARIPALHRLVQRELSSSYDLMRAMALNNPAAAVALTRRLPAAPPDLNDQPLRHDGLLL
jgi:hypothetical protein